MADDLERVSMADVEGESTDDKHPIDIDLGLFGTGATEAIVADLDSESLAEDGQQEVDDDEAPTRVVDADPGVEPIEGYRAEWRPSGGESDTFDPTDLQAGADVSYGAGAIDVQLRIADDIKYADDADPPVDGEPPVDVEPVVVIGGDLDESTDYYLDDPGELPEPGDGTVTEVSDTDAPRAATDFTNFEDVD